MIPSRSHFLSIGSYLNMKLFSYQEIVQFIFARFITVDYNVRWISPNLLQFNRIFFLDLCAIAVMWFESLDKFSLLSIQKYTIIDFLFKCSLIDLLFCAFGRLISFLFSVDFPFFFAYTLFRITYYIVTKHTTQNWMLNFRRACQFCYSTTTTQSVESILESEYSCRGISVRFAFVESCRVRYRAWYALCVWWCLSHLSLAYIETNQHSHTLNTRKNTCSKSQTRSIP